MTIKGCVTMKSSIFGEVTVPRMVECIKEYIEKDRESVYSISIGTDSQNRELTKVVVVVAIHRVGKGGIFFHDTKYVPKISNIRQKIYFETALSLELAATVSQYFAEKNIKQDIAIHVDIGKNVRGGTHNLVQEIVGWIKGAGYICEIKPNSLTAFCIADRLSK